MTFQHHIASSCWRGSTSHTSMHTYLILWRQRRATAVSSPLSGILLCSSHQFIWAQQVGTQVRSQASQGNSLLRRKCLRMRSRATWSWPTCARPNMRCQMLMMHCGNLFENDTMKLQGMLGWQGHKTQPMELYILCSTQERTFTFHICQAEPGRCVPGCLEALADIYTCFWCVCSFAGHSANDWGSSTACQTQGWPWPANARGHGWKASSFAENTSVALPALVCLPKNPQ